MFQTLAVLMLAGTLVAQGPARGHQTARVGREKPTAAVIREYLAPLVSRYRLKFYFEPEQIPKCTWKLEFATATQKDLPVLLSYVRLFAEEWRKYPPEFVKRSKLSGICFVKDLKLKKQKRAALPDYFNERLYYDFGFLRKSSRLYLRHVVHHEYYHMLEQQWNGNAYYKDPAWARLNTKGFHYGSGGANARSPGVGRLDHPKPGFVNAYAMSGLEEDKAEIWALLFVPQQWRLVSRWKESDGILAAKVRYLEAFARKKDKGMNTRYWVRIREPGRKETRRSQLEAGK